MSPSEELPRVDTPPPHDGELDEALEESFPASDPLATWSGADRDPLLHGAVPGGGPG